MFNSTKLIKMKTKLFITALAFSVSIGITSAQTQQKAQQQTAKGKQAQSAYVDKKNNNVCDNFENGTPRNANGTGKQGLRNGSGSHQGKGMHRGAGKGQGMRNGCRQGRNFVHVNKDGICDNYAAGNRQRRGNGGGRQANFVDKNKDGVCDNSQGKPLTTKTK